MHALRLPPAHRKRGGPDYRVSGSRGAELAELSGAGRFKALAWSCHSASASAICAPKEIAARRLSSDFGNEISGNGGSTGARLGDLFGGGAVSVIIGSMHLATRSANATRPTHAAVC
jgi:hypothetical protein